MSFDPRNYLQHIVLEADYLIGQTPGLSFEAFVANETRCRAFVRSLEIIGEAATWSGPREVTTPSTGPAIPCYLPIDLAT